MDVGHYNCGYHCLPAFVCVLTTFCSTATAVQTTNKYDQTSDE